MAIFDLTSWLKNYRLGADIIGLDAAVESVLLEMEKGLSPEGSSFPMLPTYIETDKSPPRDQSVIAIDAGGTNLRISCVRFTQGEPEIEHFENFPMPGRQEEIEITEFFDYIASRVAPVAKGRDRIGFCFSFPARIHPDKDGEILLFDKEIKVKNAAGSMLGQGLISALKRQGIGHIKKVVVLNDTVAAALGARAQMAARQYGGFVGFILGTGLNICYSEDNSRITKEPGIAAQPGSMLINVEAAMFDRIPKGQVDIELDRDSHDPGRCLMEKMVSGAYIGEVFRRAVTKAKDDRLLTLDTQAIAHAHTKEMSEFMDNPFSGLYAELCPSDAERETVWKIGDAVVKRAARLAASVILAACVKSGQANDPLHPVFVSAEGTTFYKLHGLRREIERDIYGYANEHGLFMDLGFVDNKMVYGSAIAAYL